MHVQNKLSIVICETRLRLEPENCPAIDFAMMRTAVNLAVIRDVAV